MAEVEYLSCQVECGKEASSGRPPPNFVWSQEVFDQCVNTTCGQAPDNSKQCLERYSSYMSDYVTPIGSRHIELVDLEITSSPEKDKEDISRRFLASNCPELY